MDLSLWSLSPSLALSPWMLRNPLHLGTSNKALQRHHWHKAHSQTHFPAEHNPSSAPLTQGKMVPVQVPVQVLVRVRRCRWLWRRINCYRGAGGRCGRDGVCGRRRSRRAVPRSLPNASIVQPELEAAFRPLLGAIIKGIHAKLRTVCSCCHVHWYGAARQLHPIETNPHCLRRRSELNLKMVPGTVLDLHGVSPCIGVVICWECHQAQLTLTIRVRGWQQPQNVATISPEEELHVRCNILDAFGFERKAEHDSLEPNPALAVRPAVAELGVCKGTVWGLTLTLALVNRYLPPIGASKLYCPDAQGPVPLHPPLEPVPPPPEIHGFSPPKLDCKSSRHQQIGRNHLSKPCFCRKHMYHPAVELMTCSTKGRVNASVVEMLAKVWVRAHPASTGDTMDL